MAENRLAKEGAILFCCGQLARLRVKDLDTWHKELHVQFFAPQDDQLLIVDWTKRWEDTRFHPLRRNADQRPLFGGLLAFAGCVEDFDRVDSLHLCSAVAAEHVDLLVEVCAGVVLTVLAQVWPRTDRLGTQVVNVDSFEAILVGLHLVRRASCQVDESLVNASDSTVERLEGLVNAVLRLCERLGNHVDL